MIDKSRIYDAFDTFDLNLDFEQNDGNYLFLKDYEKKGKKY